MLILYGIEFAHHLRKSPCSQRCQYYDEKQPERIRTEEGCKRPRICSILADTGETCYSFCKAAVSVQNGGNDSYNAEQHDYALYEIIDRGGHVTAYYDIYAGQHRHCYYAYSVIYSERHTEQS